VRTCTAVAFMCASEEEAAPGGYAHNLEAAFVPSHWFACRSC
jgi:hypothetical protein